MPQLKTGLISVSSCPKWTLMKAPVGHDGDADGSVGESDQVGQGSD